MPFVGRVEVRRYFGGMKRAGEVRCLFQNDALDLKVLGVMRLESQALD
jgi:hypothetical protein